MRATVILFPFLAIACGPPMAGPNAAGPGASAAGGEDQAGGGAGCADITGVTFPDPRCERCMRAQCCSEVAQCAADEACAQCTQDPTANPEACNASPEFGDPSSVFATKFVRCQTDRCGEDCQGVGGGPRCPPGDPRYPNC